MNGCGEGRHEATPRYVLGARVMRRRPHRARRSQSLQQPRLHCFAESATPSTSTTARERAGEAATATGPSRRANTKDTAQDGAARTQTCKNTGRTSSWSVAATPHNCNVSHLRAMPSPLNLYLFTYNCALLPIVPAALSTVFFRGLADGSPSPDLVVVSLQELAEPSIALLGSRYLEPSFQRAISAVQDAAKRDLNESYSLVGQHSIGMTGMVVLAKDPERVVNVRYAEKGTSKWEMGIKGGVALKLGLALNNNSNSETVDFIFVGAHLTPHEIFIKERNKDWENLVRGLVFEEPAANDIETSHGIYHHRSHLFVLGYLMLLNLKVKSNSCHSDFNYRTSSKSPSLNDQRAFPQPDPSSDRISVEELLRRDQLTAERRAFRTFHGLEEVDITFPPTFKFIIDQDEDYNPMAWNWAKHRWPSWCDRILYLPFNNAIGSAHMKGFTIHKYTSIPEIMTSDHKPVTLHLSVPAQPLSATSGDVRLNPPFPIDRDSKSRRIQARRKEFLVGLLAWTLALRLGWVLLLSAIAIYVSWWWLAASWGAQRIYT